jgi:two-component system chemotaxis response regulator CheB
MTARERLARTAAIAIGTSAGGVEALSALLPALPKGLRVPVFVVIHIPRDQPSLLVGIYSPKCALPVVEAEDKMPIAPGTVYFAPPDYHMLIDGGCLAMSADEPVHFSRPSIDVLFESAADAYGDATLGVLLTGGSQDGSSGLEAVHRAGGVTVVQHPEDAHMPLMVDAALRRVAADFVLPLRDIAGLFATEMPR